MNSLLSNKQTGIPATASLSSVRKRHPSHSAKQEASRKIQEAIAAQQAAEAEAIEQSKEEEKASQEELAEWRSLEIPMNKDYELMKNTSDSSRPSSRAEKKIQEPKNVILFDNGISSRIGKKKNYSEIKKESQELIIESNTIVTASAVPQNGESAVHQSGGGRGGRGDGGRGRGRGDGGRGDGGRGRGRGDGGRGRGDGGRGRGGGATIRNGNEIINTTINKCLHPFLCKDYLEGTCRYNSHSKNHHSHDEKAAMIMYQNLRQKCGIHYDWVISHMCSNILKGLSSCYYHEKGTCNYSHHFRETFEYAEMISTLNPLAIQYNFICSYFVNKRCTNENCGFSHDINRANRLVEKRQKAIEMTEHFTSPDAYDDYIKAMNGDESASIYSKTLYLNTILDILKVLSSEPSMLSQFTHFRKLLNVINYDGIIPQFGQDYSDEIINTSLIVIIDKDGKHRLQCFGNFLFSIDMIDVGKRICGENHRGDFSNTIYFHSSSDSHLCSSFRN
jgi:hypothetical protein